MKKRTSSFFVIVLLAAFLAAGEITALHAEGQCGEFPLSPYPGVCMVQVWRAWIVAGKNNYTDPRSGVWESSISFSYLDDGQPAAGTSCGFTLYDQNGDPLKYYVKNARTGSTILEAGYGGTGLSPGDVDQFRLTTPTPDAPFLAGPASIICYSTDPAVLRSRLVVVNTFSLLTPEGEKITEVSETIPLKSSWKWSFPLDEGRDGSNWYHVGIAMTNVATRQQTNSQPVTVRVSTQDMVGNKGPYRDIVLNPPAQDNPIIGSGIYNFFPGETKAFVLWTLFGNQPYEGNGLFFPYMGGKPRGERIIGTVTVESLGKTPISVVATKAIDPKYILTAVPASPIPMPPQE